MAKAFFSSIKLSAVPTFHKIPKISYVIKNDAQVLIHFYITQFYLLYVYLTCRLTDQKLLIHNVEGQYLFEIFISWCQFLSLPRQEFKG